MDLGLDGNVAVVSASSGGLGKGCATALAREGANVAVNGRDPDRLAAAADEIRGSTTGEVLEVPGDITDPDAVATLIERPLDEWGRLDHLVTSAGGPPRMPAPEADDASWYAAYDLLVMSVVRLVRAAGDALSDGGGSVVHVTSKTTKEPTRTNVHSSSVRTAVVGFAKVLSMELAPDVRVNTILPGRHDSPRVEAGIERAVELGEHDTREAARQARLDNIPVRRFGDPVRLGDAAAFLCSERASFINGATLPIDGGELHGVF